MSVLASHCVDIKTDVAYMASDINNSTNEVKSIKTHLKGLPTNTMTLKGDLHGLAKNVVESKIVSKGTKDECQSRSCARRRLCEHCVNKCYGGGQQGCGCSPRSLSFKA